MSVFWRVPMIYDFWAIALDASERVRQQVKIDISCDIPKELTPHGADVGDRLFGRHQKMEQCGTLFFVLNSLVGAKKAPCRLSAS